MITDEIRTLDLVLQDWFSVIHRAPMKLELAYIVLLKLRYGCMFCDADKALLELRRVSMLYSINTEAGQLMQPNVAYYL